MTEMTSTADTARIVPEEGRSMNDKTSKITFLCVAVAVVISLVALVLAIVGVANNGGNQYNINSGGNSLSADGSPGSPASSDDKIWMFGIGHYVGKKQYLDEATGTIRGYDVDLVNAVCQKANKNCRLVWDLYERCWDSAVGKRAHGGVGLMGGWYDACMGWTATLDRARTFLFSDALAQATKNSLWKKKGRSFTYPNFNGQKVGFLDGWYVDEHCLARYDDVQGFDQSSDDQVIHYANEDILLRALESGDVDVGFVSEVFFEDEHPQLELAQSFPDDNKCLIGGTSMMMPKDQTELADWFNAAFRDIKDTSVYQEICNKIDTVHGDQPDDSTSTNVCV